MKINTQKLLCDIINNIYRYIVEKILDLFIIYIQFNPVCKMVTMGKNLFLK